MAGSAPPERASERAARARARRSTRPRDSFPFNMLAAYALALPASLPGRVNGLPSPVPPLYTALTGLLVALFGLAYAWMATRSR